MPRSQRVLSFMSQWGGPQQHRKNSPSTTAPPSPAAPSSPSRQPPPSSSTPPPRDSFSRDGSSPSPAPRARADSRPSSRPMSMIQTFQPPVMEVGRDTLPELQRIFTFLNSHSNKLYQEGYFLKFHDTDSRGRPAPDRRWQEYFVQLVGTILSLWDASDLDRAAADAEVLPVFINLTDAAIHMIPTMTLNDGKKLDNILSVSTAASNKYLFHFDSFHALTQWTASIRLATYEHTTLQEAYTGALIAGKGKTLNNIRDILERQCPKYDDWVRVRFGAGTPWRRCWCVVSPPDHKEYAKLQKNQKKQKVYERNPIILKGDIKFYDTKKITKKTKAIATVKDAYSCYAIYPASKPLIDQSTLVKVEGKITIHSNPENTTEGFVFIMPESRPAVTGFEIMLQFLFPVFDTFNLYGRPKKLIADVLDTRGLMFAMPSDRRYGYLEIWDVVTLINTDGSQAWSEREWRKRLKGLTSTRMTAGPDPDLPRAGRRNTVSRETATGSRTTLRFEERGSAQSQPSTRQSSPTKHSVADFEPQEPRRSGTAPPSTILQNNNHRRSASETLNTHNPKFQHLPSRLAHEQHMYDDETPPAPPAHGVMHNAIQSGITYQHESSESTHSDESPIADAPNLPELPIAPNVPPQGFVEAPPTLSHGSYQPPPVRPTVSSAMKPNPAVDSATLHQMADAGNTSVPLGVAAAGATAAWKTQQILQSRRNEDLTRTTDDSTHLHLNTGSRSPYNDHPTGQRLATIPASPYVEHSEFVASQATYQPIATAVPDHREVPLQQAMQDVPYRTRPDSVGGPIQRKPLPGPSLPSSNEAIIQSDSSSTLGSLRDEVIDPDALDALDPTESTLFFNHGKISLQEDDAVSSSTPDYASSVGEEIVPHKAERREDRTRSGVFKVIGDPNLRPKLDSPLDMTHPSATRDSNPDDKVPLIDFGPTYVLGLDSKRPGTSGTMTQKKHEYTGSRSKENAATTPTEQPRSSYLSGRVTPNALGNARNDSPSPRISDSRTMAWSPGLVSPQRAERHKLDPEEWVMHRASQSQQNLLYGHGRSKSHTPPPLVRARSGDWSQPQRTPEGSPNAARPPSRPLSRPLSRGADRLLDQRPTVLSAREQEHVARMTNTPLVDLARNDGKAQPQHAPEGLTGYIDFREREKAAVQLNRQSAAMQAEIERRKLQVHQKQMIEAQRQQRQMMEYQHQQMAQMTRAPTQAPSMYAPSVMGMSMAHGYRPTTPIGMAYSTPSGYGESPQMQPQRPTTPHMPIPGAWGNTSPQSQPSHYFPHQPTIQPYGASFDQAQAAKYAQRNSGQYRQ